MRIQHIITDYIARTILTVNGDIITRISGVLSRLALGSSNEVLRVNTAGTALVYGLPRSIGDVNNLDIKCKKLDIGDWNMDTAMSVTLAHGLDYSKIISVSCSIRKDALDWVRPLNVGQNDLIPEQEGFINGWNAVNINLYRATGGIFDSASYSATSFNRGFVFIWYLA